MKWQPALGRDKPAPFAAGQIEFCLTQAERSKVALYTAQAIAAVAKQNERDAQQALSAWKGRVHRVGEALS